MTALGGTHTGAAVVALVVGAAVLLAPKGTRLHRRMGWAYVAAMVTLNVTALFIYRLFGRVGPFHVGAVLSLATVVVGVAAARRRRLLARDAAGRTRALERHYFWMCFSYVGLAAAAVSEVATRLPALRPVPGAGAVFGVTVAVASLVVILGGAYAIRRRRADLLRPFLPRP